MLSASAPTVNDPAPDEIEPPLGPCTHDLPTPTVLAGRPARNWWAITPGYRNLHKREKPATRGYVHRRVGRLEDELAEIIRQQDARIAALERGRNVS
jgi:hypothetical protein